jgi:hypothetical protein
VGRLSAEEGVTGLVEAWGERADADRARRRTAPVATHRASRIQHVSGGAVPPGKTTLLMSQARVVILPALAYAGDPLVIIEAFAAGTLVACFGRRPLDKIGWRSPPSASYSIAASGRCLGALPHSSKCRLRNVPS